MIEALAWSAPPLALLLAGTIRSLRRGLDIGDEGYLVYGTLALMRGEVPIRDFRAYDPGRYLWCAPFFWLFGPGFVSARIAMACLAGIATVLVVHLTLWASGAPVLAAVTGCLAVLWMQPFCKHGESLFSVICVLAITMLGSHSAAALGAAMLMVAGAVYGHNLLVYMLGAIGLYGLTRLAAGEQILPQLGSLLLWLLAGLALVVGTAALVPGYWPAFWARKVRVVFARGTANLPLPKPWLWAGNIRRDTAVIPERAHVFKALFTMLPVIYGSALLGWLVLPGIRSQPAGHLLLASGVTGLAFLHHLWSRADLAHLYQVMQPLVLLCASAAVLILPSELAIAAMLGLCFGTAAFLWPTPEFARSWRPHSEAKPFDTVYERLLLAPGLADRMNGLAELVTSHSQVGSAIFSAPLNVAIIAALDRRTAVYDCFPVYASSPQAELCMLRELDLSRPSIAIIGKIKIDDRTELLFDTNYTRVHAYVRKNYVPILSTPAETVYRKRDACT